MRSKRTHALHANMSSLVREEMVDGVQYVVCPAILINEGVHNGVFYPASELSKHTDAWNGRPVVLGHPTAQGKPVTANSKKVKETIEIGMLLNAFWDSDLKALKADVYINRDKCKTRAPRVLEKLDNEEGMDVSTGLFTDDEFKANSFNQKEYECIARNHRPDHLAVLPDGRGACSWEDGAGLPRVNEEEESEDAELTDVCDDCGTRLEDGKCPRCASEQKQNSSLFSRFLHLIGISREDVEKTEPRLNEASFNERIQKISSAVNEKYHPAVKEWGPFAASPSGPMPWVQDVYDTWFVYNIGEKNFRVDYEWDPELETVTLTSEPEEVARKQVYAKVMSPKANGGSGSGNFGHAGRPGERGGSGGGGGGDGFGKPLIGSKAIDAILSAGNKRILVDGQEMSASRALKEAEKGFEVRIEKDVATKQNQFLDPRGSKQPPVWAQQEGSPSMDKLMKVNSLIQNGALDPSLRETMLAAPEAVVMAFDQLATKAQRPKTLEEMVEELSPEEKKKLEEMAAAKKAKDEADGKEGKDLIAKIKGNAANKFDDETLGAMTVPQLRTLSEMLPSAIATNHSVAAGGVAPHVNDGDNGVPDMPSLDDAIKANQLK